MIESENRKEKAILAAVEQDKSPVSAEDCLYELAELADTAGIEVLDKLIQKREAIHRAHYFGKGKLDELRALVSFHEADVVICDDELSDSQMRNISEVVGVPVIDRTMLILDIFEQHARTGESKLQVELANLRYRLTHLTGYGKSMSRIGGGAGTHTRGAGETKLELDRRYIRDKIAQLNQELENLQKQRDTERKSRERSRISVVSLAGYTNAGKSTLMNAATQAGVLAENKLFATLDTTTRRLSLPGGTDILLTDTVGFIRKLPHTLVSAFRSTLTDMRYADIILHVVDAANPMRDSQMATVYRTLSELECDDRPIITVYNKTDLPIDTPLPTDSHATVAVNISAKTGAGVSELLAAIETELNKHKRVFTILLPYAEGRLLNLIHGNCEIVAEEHRADGIYMELYADESIRNKLAAYETQSQ